MKNSFEYISFRTELSQSKLFGANYEHVFDVSDANPVINYFITDVADLLNKILSECVNITQFQTDMLHKIFIAFNDVRAKIDPNRLSSFEYAFSSDDELLLYRNTNKGLINIIINPEECIAFSAILKTEIKNILEFYDETFNDFEMLAYRFFS